MDGDNWTNNENSLSEAPLGEWHGVGTNSNGHVFNVRLTDNQLSGELPSELGSLTYLIVLGATDNQLSGEIPVELANLSYLASLELGGNRLSGEIPPELGSLSNMEFLHLDCNQLTGEIPSELGSLSNLKRLVLGGNQLTGCIPGGLRGVEVSDVEDIGLPFCGETATDSTDTPAATPTPEWDGTVTFSLVHNVDQDISPKTHVLEIPMEKCSGLVFDLTATEVVYVSHTSPDGERGDWGHKTTLGPHFTDWREAEGIYQLEVKRKYGETTPSEVTVSYRVGPLPPSYQCDPADQ